MTLRAGKDSEFARFVDAHSVALLRAAFLLTGEHSAAEDVLQSTLFKLYRVWDRLDTSVDAAVLGYARRILYTTHVSMWRTRARELLPGPLPERLLARDVFSEQDEHDELWRLVLRLPRMQRAVVVLRYYENLSEAEIASVLQISTGSVKVHASRAIRRLRHLEASGASHDTGSDQGAGYTEAHS